jgi:ribosome modulation factor
MKTKNKLNELAYKMGYKCGVSGKSKKLNPFNESNDSKSKNWKLGWNEGYTNYNLIGEGITDFLTKYSDAFFDGLTQNTIKRALNNVKEDPDAEKVRSVVKKIKDLEQRKKELDDLANQVENDLKRFL